ncbi:hypothetical protein EX30DRAFT_353195 [Ascodesmis nigricans]|uniref:Uncharacterized protein n=1 Tax=Ascodesmis nigricans TaxID=341454 RepID=A0A4S2N6S8_9PEZI|nr:hypothetical protein EX30DRAFT_353195 [Ascodesmis nigricans]
MLPQEFLSSISLRYPCRTTQLQLLSALIGSDSFPSPQAFIIHGLESTGKTAVTHALLEESGHNFTWISCNECITPRQLTERIAATITTELAPEETNFPRCETVNALTVYLQQLLGDDGKKHFLVLDRIDQQRDAPPTLMASLRRMGEMIPKLTVIFIVSVPHPRLLHSVELPHVHFPPYTKEESIEILSLNPLPIDRIRNSDRDEESDDESEDEDDAEETAKLELAIWKKFCATVWDSLGKGAARSLTQFRDAVEKNWAPFVEPIAKGDYGLKQFSSLLVLNKDMFRRENTIIDTVIPASTTERPFTVKSHDLPHYSKYLVCAAYLASYNQSRHDALVFAKGREGKKKRRGGRAGGRVGKKRKIARRLLGPTGFPIERLLAIFYSIVPHDIPPAVDILSQIATLTSMRILIKASALDPLDGSAKWKVNVAWEYARGIARSIKFDIEDYLIE